MASAPFTYLFLDVARRAAALSHGDEVDYANLTGPTAEQRIRPLESSITCLLVAVVIITALHSEEGPILDSFVFFTSPRPLPRIRPDVTGDRVDAARAPRALTGPPNDL